MFALFLFYRNGVDAKTEGQKMTVRFIIVATVIETGEPLELFTWTRNIIDGIARAKRDAVRFGMADKLTDYRAVRLEVAQ